MPQIYSVQKIMQSCHEFVARKNEFVQLLSHLFKLSEEYTRNT